MDRVGVTLVLVANCNTMVWRGVGCFVRAPQAEIEVLGLRGGLVCFNDEGVGGGPVFILEKLICEVNGQGMCVQGNGDKPKMSDSIVRHQYLPWRRGDTSESRTSQEMG